MGDAVWSMYDYNRGCCDNICYSGVADIFRLPKFSLSFFRTQIAEGSMLPSGKMPYEVFIPAYRDEILSDTVMVYGNVDEVELVLNGKQLTKARIVTIFPYRMEAMARIFISHRSRFMEYLRREGY